MIIIIVHTEMIIFLISKTSPFRGGNAIAETTENQKLG